MRRQRYWMLLIAFAMALPLRAQTFVVEEQKPFQVTFDSLIDNNLHFLFTAIADRANLEAWFCMLGDQASRDVRVSWITPIWVDSADDGHLIGNPLISCPGNTVGTIHFHPGVGFCNLSDADIMTSHILGDSDSLSYRVAAIVCRDSSGKRPQLVTMRRSELDDKWSRIPEEDGIASDTMQSIFIPTYRYKRP